MKFWKKILGFVPEKELEPVTFESKCYKCESKKIEKLNSQSWTGKYMCNECGYFTYVLFSDRMGGALNEDVSISKQNSLIF